MARSNRVLRKSVADVIQRAKHSGKPLAIILAGHNGSGKSTMWYEHLVDGIRIPLINADRMMLSILPVPDETGRLRPWAQKLRDEDQMWMAVAQKGVESFVAQAMAKKVPFAVETVFSYWQRRRDGTHASKIDMIVNLQAAGYFVLLLFVGLSSGALSIGRVATRVAEGGHSVDFQKLLERFPRTQQAIRHALPVADAVVLVDNSRDASLAFTPSYISAEDNVLYDIRTTGGAPTEIASWLDIVVPE
ncbi:zeta toxin family protein [Ralstonia solanacearum]|uniref:zeta toxin family protein n=1 Tax=Ralstonia solanacearum TaxID=305 RepID=UPI00078E69F0|nr:zeta toxin family protein [Ralstonia solanacearum]AMP39510.1 toxin [Ralstonia solanacearum]AXV88345.1 toxin [Ralstonia solanacearum]AXW07824.1 toxin [Ralstonia solanacearum]AXW25616.1 toxin [Ralstonia solanacearum]AXW82528.1 toxin [Ralstonia solanacearum]